MDATPLLGLHLASAQHGAQRTQTAQPAPTHTSCTTAAPTSPLQDRQPSRRHCAPARPRATPLPPAPEPTAPTAPTTAPTARTSLQAMIWPLAFFTRRSFLRKYLRPHRAAQQAQHGQHAHPASTMDDGAGRGAGLAGWLLQLHGPLRPTAPLLAVGRVPAPLEPPCPALACSALRSPCY